MLTVRRIAAFYYIPILIFLLKKLLAALTSGQESIIYHDPDEDDNQSGTCICDCSDCIFSCNPPHMKNMPRCPGHRVHHCNFGKDCNEILLPPCGGCNTDPFPFPALWRPDAKWINEEDYYRMYHRDLSKIRPKRIPIYGPGNTPINCVHPPCNPPPCPGPCPDAVNNLDCSNSYEDDAGWDDSGI